ncbi:hypothetical protein CathTA2_0707 [Caldalkalibacillus thermarum TA2.A1]|uniref:Uncharacterized protein n=1 Tax=Caldalkalibacillus thermarum (strain TA2.A1) TaxID=986075 RepID=F5L4J4_CALTT|nr:hypothetical protein [Caldalkalibacillus thermarum]EGL83740.1 hypothetical protein CathTA2_0707 [Caldalkalibacillus thermarum TA2.A1]QZT33981.1 hypothetical protein HUR95_00635 [Caldalkalibacillus thermarum TA2.A1]
MAYNTREIIRDVRKNPIPQYFNETENQYQPVTGDKAPYTQIVDVNGNPISSENRLPVDAQLSGSFNAVVFEYLNSTLNLNTVGNRWYGANAVTGTTNRRPADVSRFSKKLVYVKNNYNVTAYVIVNFYKDVEPFSGSAHGPFIYRAVDVEPVPAGAAAIFSIDTEPKMGLPAIGLGVNIWADNPTEGSIDIVLIGGV